MFTKFGEHCVDQQQHAGFGMFLIHLLNVFLCLSVCF